MKVSNEIKAGIVIVAAILISLLFFVRTASFPTKTYNLKTYFGYAGDLKKDAIVKLSGIEAGRVTNIKFIYEPETKIECILTLSGGIKVRKDSTAYIGTSGFVGDAYVGLTAGKLPEFFKPGATVASEDPVQMRELMKKADKIADGLGELTTNVNGIVADNRQGVNNIVSNFEATSKNFEEFSGDLKKHPWKLLFKGE